MLPLSGANDDQFELASRLVGVYKVNHMVRYIDPVPSSGKSDVFSRLRASRLRTVTILIGSREPPGSFMYNVGVLCGDELGRRPGLGHCSVVLSAMFVYIGGRSAAQGLLPVKGKEGAHGGRIRAEEAVIFREHGDCGPQV